MATSKREVLVKGIYYTPRLKSSQRSFIWLNLSRISLIPDVFIKKLEFRSIARVFNFAIFPKKSKNLNLCVCFCVCVCVQK